MDYWWIMKKFWYFILKRGLKGTQIQKFCIFYYLTLEIVKQDKCPKYSGSRILQCPAIYCVKWNTVFTLWSTFQSLSCFALCSPLLDFFCFDHYVVSWSSLLYLLSKERDLHLPMQSVPIIVNVVSLIPASNWRALDTALCDIVYQ